MLLTVLISSQLLAKGGPVMKNPLKAEHLESFKRMAGAITSESEEEEISNYLGDTCGDTFCGGDFNFGQIWVECNALNCETSMQARPYNETDAEFLVKIQKAEGQLLRIGNTFTRITGSEDTEIGLAADIFCTTIGMRSIRSLTLEEKKQRIYDVVSSECAEAAAILLR